jgi:trans-aconitate 2-methyltransferase
MKYTFGTSIEAASRLEDIARFFNPLAASLIERYASESPKVAIDLGCGPGFSTDMLSRAGRARETIGLDDSPEFLATARDRFRHCRFIEHDVTRTPFPATADIMYVRFLLSHLPEPVELMRQWATQLRPGGVLVLDETEAVESEVDVFRRYLSASAALVASQGARLFVGAELAGKDYRARTLLDECAVWPVPDSRAATWFLPNTKTVWRSSDVVLGLLSLSEIEGISGALSDLAGSEEKDSRITWRIRRIVLKREE